MLMSASDSDTASVRTWNCDECSAPLRAARDCDGTRGDFRYPIGPSKARVILRRCPWGDESLRGFVAEAGHHFQRYNERGCLPNAGGTGDQPARIMRAMDIIDGEIGRVRAADAKANK